MGLRLYGDGLICIFSIECAIVGAISWTIKNDLQGKRLCWGSFVSCPKPHGVAFREKLSNLDCLRFSSAVCY
ncbi:hypothetical protein BDV40DRAFT_264461 [Aspergillus tamarii]|uniref:Uncharacterized protein n=1 Tax=Aspergillus tamarii TaxID=41984 RepID=A0A5N6UVX5_ASPTM|nr:hypothetical protein BDV40DRAFT_264461 [Aspergillus tamarii]